MKVKTRLILNIILLVALILGVGAIAYGYWASGKTKAEKSVDAEIGIGSGEVVEVEITVLDENGKTLNLVPESVGSNHTATYTYAVTWEETVGLLGATGTLKVSLTDFKIGDNASNEYIDLFEITITPETTSIAAGETKTFTITLVFVAEPATEADYNKIINKDIKLTIGVEVDPN